MKWHWNPCHYSRFFSWSLCFLKSIIILQNCISSAKLLLVSLHGHGAMIALFRWPQPRWSHDSTTTIVVVAWNFYALLLDLRHQHDGYSWQTTHCVSGKPWHRSRNGCLATEIRSRISICSNHRNKRNDHRQSGRHRQVTYTIC